MTAEDPPVGPLLCLTATELEVLEVAHLHGLAGHRPTPAQEGEDPGPAWMEAIASLTARGLLDARGRLHEGTAAGQAAQTMLDVRLAAGAVVVPLPSEAAAPAHTLTLRMSEVAWQGDAQFTVSLDGTQLGGVYTATAFHAAGAVQDFAFGGDYATGAHTVSIRFLNDAYGGTPQTDRDLYVDAILMEGVQQTKAATAITWNHTVDFAVTVADHAALA